MPLLLALAALAAPPNLVVILTDDLDAGLLDELPELRPLMQDEGATFVNAYVSLSLCCPSRATILRGQYAHNTGVFWNRAPSGGYAKFHTSGAEESTIATWLQDGGYDTALYGKYLNGYPEDGERRRVPPGWTDWFVPVSGNPYGGFRYTVNHNGRLSRYGDAPEDYITDVLAREGAAYVAEKAAAKRPFFLMLSTYAPHGPETPAPRHEDLYADARAPRRPSFDEADVSDKPPWTQALSLLGEERTNQIDERHRRRLRSMRGVVDLVDSTISALRTAGQLENTWIVFTSDNGWHMGEHRMRPGKNTAIEEDLRVPLIVRGPGVAAKSRVDALVVNTDFAPTLAEWAGVTPPDWVDGRSFAPLLRGETPPWRQAFLLEHRGPVGPAEGGRKEPPKSVMEPPDYSIEETKPGDGIPVFAGLHTRDLVYVEYRGGEVDLYDLAADPWQLQDIAATADPARLADLHAWVEVLRTCAAVTCRRAEDGPPPR